MISATTKNNDNTTKALQKMKRRRLLSKLDSYGQRGVQLLRSGTPVNEGLTAAGWKYRIVEERNGPRVEWYNTHPDNNGRTPVAVLIQYGHATKNGGYVQGRDYINPAIQPMFDQIITEIWNEVKA